VAGVDEAGRGSLAGPLVVAGVLLDYELLHGHRVRPLALLNDSKQVEPELREVLLRAVLGAATQVSVRVIPACDIDRNGLHRSNLWGLRTVLAELHPPAEACLVDGFRLGPLAPPHTAVVDGDTKSAAIAAASIVAKVMRDRMMCGCGNHHDRYGFEVHDVGPPVTTPIIPVVVGDDWKAVMLWRALYDAGVYVNVALHPAVPPAGALLRTSVMATHDRATLDRALEAFSSVKSAFESEHGPLPGESRI